jgi:hypothetical protein
VSISLLTQLQSQVNLGNKKGIFGEPLPAASLSAILPRESLDPLFIPKAYRSRLLSHACRSLI